ncbi:tetratricopeptide repeat protein [Shimia isoporae]|uniref:Tetratricopeptide repeat protein n=1 Tax=Shimia isoporae TaxID=647720 RepID=A0A4R1NP00_9RHOB|nr:tetratricopeptide repeat protein [Shimia isoporae]
MRILGFADTQGILVYVMVNFTSHLKRAVAAFAVTSCVCGAFPVLAQEENPDTAQIELPGPQDLAGMMQQLRDAEEGAASSIADRIRREWNKSGSATADFLLKRGETALENGEYAQAIDHLTALTDHAPDFAAGWALRARTFFEMDEYGRAIGDLEHVLALNPQHFDALMGLALMLDQMQHAEDAYEAYLQVKAIHPHQAGLSEAIERLEQQVLGREL